MCTSRLTSNSIYQNNCRCLKKNPADRWSAEELLDHPFITTKVRMCATFFYLPKKLHHTPT